MILWLCTAFSLSSPASFISTDFFAPLIHVFAHSFRPLLSTSSISLLCRLSLFICFLSWLLWSLFAGRWTGSRARLESPFQQQEQRHEQRSKGTSADQPFTSWHPTSFTSYRFFFSSHSHYQQYIKDSTDHSSSESPGLSSLSPLLLTGASPKMSLFLRPT